jgi:hypothetical protein
VPCSFTPDSGYDHLGTGSDTHYLHDMFSVDFAMGGVSAVSITILDMSKYNITRLTLPIIMHTFLGHFQNCMCPLERVKLLLQNQDKLASLRSAL